MTTLLLSALMLERLDAQDTFLSVVFIIEEVNTIRIVPFVIHVICKVLGQRDFYFILGPAACETHAGDGPCQAGYDHVCELLAGEPDAVCAGLAPQLNPDHPQPVKAAPGG